jgi:hypothetical protein
MRSAGRSRVSTATSWSGRRYTDNYRVTGGLLVQGDVKGAEKAWSKHVQWVIATIQRSPR